MLCVLVMSQKRLEELRELNRETFKATGEYMTEVRQHMGRGCQSVLVWWQLLALLTAGLDSGLVLCAGGDCKVQAAALDRPQVGPHVCCFACTLGLPRSFATTLIT